MPATRPNRTPGTALVLLAVMSLGLFLFQATPVARADPPTIVDNGDASKTVSWPMNSAEGLTIQGVDLENGNATLPWVPQTLSWDNPGPFGANGSLDASLTLEGGGIGLRADPRNHIADGDFASPGVWIFESSPAGNVTAQWSDAELNALFKHQSVGTSSIWDHLDSTAGWLGVSPPAGAAIWTNSTAHVEGAAMLGLNVTLSSQPDSWAGVLRMAPVDWSAYDRMIVRVLALNVDSPLTFNVTAYDVGMPYTTAARPLAAGWQDIEVDLTELGPVRDVLAYLTLRVNGRNVPSTAVYFDDLRVGGANRFDETAEARQRIEKTIETSSAFGSAVLRLNWSLPNASGILRATGAVRVSGPSGFVERPFSGLPGPGWRTFLTDISGTTMLPGVYDVNIAFRVVRSNASTSSVEARVDDVAVFFPNRQNGTYLSQAVALGAASELVRVSWSFDAPGPTAIRASLRSGDDSNPSAGSWSPWRTWGAPGSYPVLLPGGAFVQVQVDLTTTNASIGPLLRGFVLETRHHVEQPGSIVSGIFSLPEEEIPVFLRWRSLRTVSRIPAGTSISFSIGDGTSWRAVGSDGNLSGVRSTSIQWSASLATTDGRIAPTLERVELAYEYLGPAVKVELRWSGSLLVPARSQISFSAVALDAGSHVISSAANRFDWSTSDPAGKVSNTGVYEAGSVGEYDVTALYVGTNLSATVRVTVLAADFWTDAVLPILPYGLAILGLAGLGFIGYDLAIRRMFAVDDVFLISKDGRLLMHNTRRLRADRDADILAAMLTAILSFLKDSDPEENGDLRRFEIGGKTTLVERGMHANLVAVYSGRVPRWAGKDLRRFMSNLEAKFGDAFASWSGSPEDLQGLKEFTTGFVSHIRYGRLGRRSAISTSHRGNRTR